MLLLIGFQIYIDSIRYTYLATATVPNGSNMYCLILDSSRPSRFFGYTYTSAMQIHYKMKMENPL